MSNWKNFERRVAAKVGGKRIPITGRECLDIDHPYLDIECKHRQTYPLWFEKAWRQANTGNGIPVIALGKKYSNLILTVISIETLAMLMEYYIIHHNEQD